MRVIVENPDSRKYVVIKGSWNR